MKTGSIVLCCLYFGVSLFISGCATIIHGTSQKLCVATNPPGATVSDGTQTLETPAVIKLKRKRDHILTISKPGYETTTVPIMHVVSSAVAANLLSFGLIGWGIDAVTGAQWELVPETVSVVLRPLLPGEIDRATGIIAGEISEARVCTAAQTMGCLLDAQSK